MTANKKRQSSEMCDLEIEGDSFLLTDAPRCFAKLASYTRVVPEICDGTVQLAETLIVEPDAKQSLERFGDSIPCLALPRGLQLPIHLLAGSMKMKVRFPVRELSGAPQMVRVKQALAQLMSRPSEATDSNFHRLAVDSDFLEFIKRNERGIVRFSQRAVDPAWLIAETAIAFPSERIAAVTHSKKSLTRLRQRLAAFWPASLPYCEIKEEHSESALRLQVGTFSQLSLRHRRFFDIIIIVDALASIAKSWQFLFDRREARRVIGLISNDASSSQAEVDLLVRRFGLASLRIHFHGIAERFVDVNWSKFQHRSQLADDASFLDVKRTEIWHGRRRNQHVAKLARSLAIGDPETLKEVGRSQHSPIPPRVAILVENAEHAVTLLAELKRWKILGVFDELKRNAPKSLRSLLTDESCVWPTLVANPDQRRWAKLFEPPRDVPISGAGFIIPYDQSTGVVLSDIDILIRADGGRGLPETFVTFVIGEPNGSTMSRPMTLIDIDDVAHPKLRRATQLRRRGYSGFFMSRSLSQQRADAVRWLKRRLGSKTVCTTI